MLPDMRMGPLVARFSRSSSGFRAEQFGRLPCSSANSRYSRSSRLALGAPRSGIQYLFSEDTLLVRITCWRVERDPCGLSVEERWLWAEARVHDGRTRLHVVVTERMT